MSEAFSNIRFESWPLLGLLLFPLLSMWLRGKPGPRPAAPFASAELLRRAGFPVRAGFGRFRAVPRHLALLLLILALARPQLELGVSDDQSKGINIMLVLDFSSTMNTRDFTMENRKVTRSEALIKVISEFMRTRPNDRIGLVRFDADAFLVSPLTLDHDWLIGRLKEEKTGRGTAPGSGMLIAAEHLLPATNQTKVMILVSDAAQVNHGPSPITVAKAIGPLGIRMHLIQIVDFREMGGMDRGENEMAQAPHFTQGQLFQVADFTGLRTVYQQIDKLEKAKMTEEKKTVYRELMAWFAIPGFCILILEFLLRNTIWRSVP